jgi:hypothetical protein
MCTARAKSSARPPFVFASCRVHLPLALSGTASLAIEKKSSAG